jgi:hypothetical protein
MSKHFEMLPEEAFQKVGKSMKLYKKGAGGPTETSVQQSNIPEYAQPYVESMLGAAQQQIFNVDGSGNISGFNEFKPYSTNMGDYVAGFSPMQQQAFQGAANLQAPGQIGAGSQLAGAAGLGALGAGQQFQQQATNPYAVQAYMNPYLQSSLAPQIEAMRRQYDITGTQQQGQATQAGAFGGTREALMAAENRRAMNSAIDATISKGYNDAFNNAQQQQQFGANLGLQGMGQAASAAGQLGQLGTQQLAAEQGILGTQQQYGAMQQQAEQQKIDQAIQNYAMQQQAPMQSLAQMSGLLRGLPLESTTTQSYQAGPGALQSLAGIGTGIAGVASMTKAEGGTVRSYAGGGIVGYAGGGDVMSQDNAEGIAQGLNADQLQQVQPRTLPDYIRIPLLNQKVQEQQAAQQAMAAQQGMADQESLKQQVLAQAEDLGITGAQSNLPDEAMMAGGGIVSFATGNVVKDPYAIPWNYEPVRPDYTQAEAILTAANEAPHTLETVAAARETEEGKRGIKDIYTPMLTKLQEKEAKLAGREDRAKGLGYLAASEAIMNAKGPGLGWMGSGLGAYGKTTGAELEKVDAIRDNLAQQDNTIRLAQNAYKEAALTNDTARMDRAKAAIVSARENKQKLTEKYHELQDTGNLKKAEAQADYFKDVKIQGMKSSQEKDTDLRNTTNIYYKDMVENKGYPANSATMALARQTAYKDIGLAERKVMVQESQAEATLNHQQNQDLAVKEKAIDKKYSLERMAALNDAAALAVVDDKIAAEKAVAKKEILRSTTKPAPDAGNANKNKVQSPTGAFTSDDGFVFPDKKSLDAYNKARGK